MALLHVPDAREGPAMLAGRPSVLQKQMNSLADVMIQEHLLRRPVDVGSMFEQGPGQRAVP
jgi:hypothetical protein